MLQIPLYACIKDSALFRVTWHLGPFQDQCTLPTEISKNYMCFKIADWLLYYDLHTVTTLQVTLYDPKFLSMTLNEKNLYRNIFLIYLWNMDHVYTKTLFLFTLSLVKGPMCVQCTATPDPPLAIISGMCMGLDIFEPLKQNRPSKSTYKVISYVDFTSYLNSFSKYENYLQNFMNALNSSDIIAHFHKAGTTCIIWGRYGI